MSGPPNNMVPFQPAAFAKITINGEEYTPRPHEVDPEKYSKDMVWSQFPWNSSFMADPEWYSSIGEDQIEQRRIWAISSETDQLDEFRKLLEEFPGRGLDLMFAAAVKGKAHVVKFLLESGVKPTARTEDGDDETLVPLHAASFQGRLDCVKLLVEQGQIDIDIQDEIGGTPLMRSCWGGHADVTEYLLSKRAKIDVRQTPAEGEETGTNAFEFAAGNGSVKCAQLIVEHAREIGYSIQHLVSPRSILAASRSEKNDILQFILQAGGYPVPGTDGFVNAVHLSEEQKGAVEAAFCGTAEAGGIVNLPTLFAYINSKNDNGENNWTLLDARTIDAVENGLILAAGHDDEAHQKAFLFFHDILFAPQSNLTNEEVRQRKSRLLHDAFFCAARGNCLKMLRCIESKIDVFNVDHISQNGKPMWTAPMYMAAGAGHYNVLEYLLDKYGKDLKPDLGNGKFANGPTTLWQAIWNGQALCTRLLLERFLGPVDSVDAAATSDEITKRIVLTATMAFRCPVGIVSEDEWTEKHGDLGDRTTGRFWDDDGNEERYLVLPIEKKDEAWLSQLRPRKTDEELSTLETNGRELKPEPHKG